MNQRKVGVRWQRHDVQEFVQKVWRFDDSALDAYSRGRVEEEVLALFPALQSKGLRLELSYEDSLVGRISIDGDADMHTALAAFVEESNLSFRTLFVEECVKPEGEMLYWAEKGPPRKKRKITESPPLVTLSELDDRLVKCYKEPDLDEQPLFVDDTEDSIKCAWCSGWSGSQQVKRVNQHCKRDKCHLKARMKALGHPNPEPLEGESSTTALAITTGASSSEPLSVLCQGVYQRKYAVIHTDRNIGTTTAKKLWMNAHDTPSDDTGIEMTCDCCTSYNEWKGKHPLLAKSLQKVADGTLIYQVCPNESITVIIDGIDTTYTGTIRASTAAPEGPCLGVASNSGKHPYTCSACDALMHGKTSTLNRIVNRAPTLKHPKSDMTRASKPGVNHKYASAACLEVAVHSRKVQSATSQQKVSRLLEANRKLLSQSWHNSASIRPFVETFINLLEENKLSALDLSFLQNWLHKKHKGRYATADDQARKLTVLYSNRLGEKMYTTTAPMLGLPSARQARRIRSKEMGDQYYLPGINSWAFELAAQREKHPLQNGMDGTRVIRVVELYREQYLVGKAFPPDVRLFPTPESLDKVDSWQQVEEYVMDVREKKLYAAEAYSFNLSDTTGKYPDVLTGSIPESRRGVTGDHILALMLEVECRADACNLPLIGHCTDSASNALNALILLSSPSTYQLPGFSISFLGLPRDDYYFFAPFIRQSYPSISYPCWDHSARTVLRNLMNDRLTLVCGKIDSCTDGFQKYLIADIKDLRKLKLNNPSSSVKFADITPHVRQNCDATSRVLNLQVVNGLKLFVLGSEGTQLYLIAATATHEPFRNDRFGPPPVVARALWKGLMIWRRWRRYVQLKEGLSLTIHFISRSHYLTEELLVHSGLNHQLALDHCFPHLSIDKFSMRNTRNRGLEAIHGVFRGGTSSLPITSPNMSFSEFLARMNKATQIHSTEHQLAQVEGNTIVASKKKRKTNAQRSTTDIANEEMYSEYTRPSTFRQFQMELNLACNEGDEDAKSVIEELAPDIAATLKEHNEWEKPNTCLSSLPADLNLVSDETPVQAMHVNTLVHQILEERLGPIQESNPARDESNSEEYHQTLANLITDISLSEHSDENESDQMSHATVRDGKKVTSLLKDLQPHREKPSKDRARRFAAGDLHSDMAIPEHHDLLEFQYWTILPLNEELQVAKLFILGQVVYITEGDKPCRSASTKNPITSIIFLAYKYHFTSNTYTIHGKSGLCKASKLLLSNVTMHVSTDGDTLTLNEYSTDYDPYHDDIDIDGRLPQQHAPLVTQDTEVDDLFIVEKIVQRRLKEDHYEYFVKWRGYSETDNTWELASNVPNDVLLKYERSLLHQSTPVQRPQGLRQSRKIKFREDFFLST